MTGITPQAKHTTATDERLFEDLICNVAEDVNSGRDEYGPEVKEIGDELLRRLKTRAELLEALKRAETGYRNLADLGAIPKTFDAEARRIADEFAGIIAKAEAVQP